MATVGAGAVAVELGPGTAGAVDLGGFAGVAVVARLVGGGAGWATAMPVVFITTTDISKQRVGLFTASFLPQKPALAPASYKFAQTRASA